MDDSAFRNASAISVTFLSPPGVFLSAVSAPPKPRSSVRRPPAGGPRSASYSFAFKIIESAGWSGRHLSNLREKHKGTQITQDGKPKNTTGSKTGAGPKGPSVTLALRNLPASCLWPGDPSCTRLAVNDPVDSLEP